MTNVNWKLLAERSGMKISVLKKSLFGITGRPRKNLLKTLAMPSDGRDSHTYTREFHPYFNSADMELSLPDDQTLWEHNEQQWGYFVEGTKRWRDKDSR